MEQRKKQEREEQCSALRPIVQSWSGPQVPRGEGQAIWDKRKPPYHGRGIGPSKEKKRKEEKKKKRKEQIKEERKKQEEEKKKDPYTTSRYII